MVKNKYRVILNQSHYFIYRPRTLRQYKLNTDIAEELNVTPFLYKIRTAEEIWIDM